MFLQVVPTELSLGLAAGCEKKKGVKMTPSILGLCIWANISISEMGMPREEGVWPTWGQELEVVYTC